MSDLDWFWSSKRQNNCSHISRSTLSEAAQLYLILHQSCFTLRSDHQDLYFHWMIFITHLLRSLYLFISQSALHYMCGSFTSHLTKTYYWRYRAIFRSFTALDLIDLHYKQQNFIILNISIQIHIFIVQFKSLNKFFSSIFSLCQTIRAIKAWSKYSFSLNLHQSVSVQNKYISTTVISHVRLPR